MTPCSRARICWPCVCPIGTPRTPALMTPSAAWCRKRATASPDDAPAADGKSGVAQLQESEVHERPSEPEALAKNFPSPSLTLQARTVLKQEIPLRHRQHLHLLARQKLAVGPHPIRVRIDANFRSRIV